MSQKPRPDAQLFPLHDAVYSHDPLMVMRLFEEGYNLNTHNTDEQTALDVAGEIGNLEIVRLLLGLGAKPSAASFKDETVNELMAARQRVITAALLKGKLVALRHSIRTGTDSVFDPLYEELVEQDKLRPHALNFLVAAVQEKNNHALARLLDLDVEINVKLPSTDQSLLMMAVKAEYVAGVQLLLQRTAKPADPDFDQSGIVERSVTYPYGEDGKTAFRCVQIECVSVKQQAELTGNADILALLAAHARKPAAAVPPGRASTHGIAAAVGPGAGGGPVAAAVAAR
jgi:hypothetical protein